MEIARIFSTQPELLHAHIVSVETDISRGLHSFSVVGLPGKAVEEARDRISSAIKHTGFPSPKSKNHKITISLAPADIRKEGPTFDVAMALSYLSAAQEIKFNPEGKIFAGELALNGEIRPVRGILSIVKTAKDNGYREVYVPKENAREASLINDIAIYGVKSLTEMIAHLDHSRLDHVPLAPLTPMTHVGIWKESVIRLEDIKGQESAKRGLMIAAAGRHNALMIGPPGTGKTMLARALESILPPLEREEALEVTEIYSIAGLLDEHIITAPPFRAPHHTASHTSIVGGGAYPKPGEVTLAHRGVLFLDEFPEFERRSIDALRQPLEDRTVAISRVQGTVQFPADFMLIAAMNPHRGAFEGGDIHAQVDEKYRTKISGPILDRIDISLEVSHISYDKLSGERNPADETTTTRENVLLARGKQKERLAGRKARTNAEMSARDIEEVIELSPDVKETLILSSQKLALSPRSYHRLIKVSRTIADIENSDAIKPEHVFEALQYRVKI